MCVGNVERTIRQHWLESTSVYKVSRFCLICVKMSSLPVPYHGAITLKSLLENPDLLNPPQLHSEDDTEKKLDVDLSISRHPSSAYLGGSLWDNTISLADPDNFKFEFMDLEEFLMENENVLPDLSPSSPPLQVPTSPGSVNSAPASPVILEPMPVIRNGNLQMSPPHMSFISPNTQASIIPVKPPLAKPSPKLDVRASPPTVDFKLNEHDAVLATIPGEEEFDPRKRPFSEEELKPQPMIKKSKKVFVPEDCKDDRYWCRRRKNNVAAKRSRDARRIKENQIALRASFLERENDVMKEQYEKIKLENKVLKARLAKYEC
ncbi:hepatic leukemia factor-like isoform X2 [Lineus longissimus]|uniref:hepatic leukemia factor-like isoform X2 n=1 Tax=Lineus longissimus TaxID=88925 RepID=UPI002B4D0A01